MPYLYNESELRRNERFHDIGKQYLYIYDGIRSINIRGTYTNTDIIESTGIPGDSSNSISTPAA